MNSNNQINKISLQLLLYFYGIVRTNTAQIQDFRFYFNNDDSLKEITAFLKTKELVKDIKAFNFKDWDLKQALEYLKDENFINFTKAPPNSDCQQFYDFRIISDGIKIIEGISDPNYKKQLEDKFSLTINFNLGSLIKAELGGFSLSLFNLDSLLK